jgi:hypothetical protein
MTQKSEVESYFASLQSRLHQAQHMRRRKVEFEGWKPESAKCHENVNIWVDHDPSAKPVRVWMVTRMDEAERCLYEAHSGQDCFLASLYTPVPLIATFKLGVTGSVLVS